jgi:ankyrin repeat protein
MSDEFSTSNPIVFCVVVAISLYLCSSASTAVPPAAADGPKAAQPNDAKPKTADDADKVAEIDRLDDKGFSKLHNAAMVGKVDPVKKLLADGAKVDVRQERFQGTPLQYAASHGHVEIVQVLIKSGAKIDARDTQGRTPLMWAADQGRPEVIRELLKAKADIRAVDNHGSTALHFAAKSQKKAAAQFLIDSGAKTDALNSQKKTPLDLAPGLGLKLPAEAQEAAALPGEKAGP